MAEWVQDEESAALLQGWGCDYIQGRLIGLASMTRSRDPMVQPHAGRPAQAATG